MRFVWLMWGKQMEWHQWHEWRRSRRRHRWCRGLTHWSHLPGLLRVGCNGRHFTHQLFSFKQTSKIAKDYRYSSFHCDRLMRRVKNVESDSHWFQWYGCNDRSDQIRGIAVINNRLDSSSTEQTLKSKLALYDSRLKVCSFGLIVSPKWRTAISIETLYWLKYIL